jgi:hypothetical protein
MNNIRKIIDKYGMDTVIGEIASSFKKGDEFKINQKTFVVTSATAEKVMIKDTAGNTYPIKKKNGVTFSGKESFKKGNWDSLARDIEGALTLDLLNDYNPFHTVNPLFTKLDSWLGEKLK